MNKDKLIILITPTSLAIGGWLLGKVAVDSGMHILPLVSALFIVTGSYLNGYTSGIHDAKKKYKQENVN